MVDSPEKADAFLIPIAGPQLQRFKLDGSQNEHTLGRHEQCHLLTPADVETISRLHARFRLDGGHWRIADMKSRWGTTLNGVRLSPFTEVTLREGDLIGVGPWTIAFSETEQRRGVRAADDPQNTIIRSVGPQAQISADKEMIALLLEASHTLHRAADENELAKTLVTLSMRGTGFSHATVLRPLDMNGRFQIVAASQNQDEQNVTFSRSLLAASMKGDVAEVIASGSEDVAQSIVQLGIHRAICVPLMVGNSPVAFLYLDSRGHSRVRNEPGGFCAAIGRMASLALANIKRIELEQRQALMENELKTAAVAQRWILPERVSRYGPLTCTGDTKPGRYVGGDFFDVIPLDEHRVAIAIGDVAGKGVTASVLMTAAQGFLHASALGEKDAGRAMRSLNRFIEQRVQASVFVTVWFGVLDFQSRRLSYVDAGHGYALMQTTGGPDVTTLGEGDSGPIGVAADENYEPQTIALPEHGRIVLVSDGFVEQPAALTSAAELQQFSFAGIRKLILDHAGDDLLEAMFAALIAHAGSDDLADDATALIAEW